MRGPRSKVDHDGQRLPPGVFWRGDVYEFMYRDSTGRQRQETVNNVESAVKLRAERMREAKRDRAILAPYKRRWRTNASRASLAAAAKRQEERLANEEAERDAIHAERERRHRRIQRLIRQLPADKRAKAEAYSLVRKALQQVERGERAEDGPPRIALRAAYQSLHEAEIAIMRSITEE